MKGQIPKVMVLVYEKALTHSVWLDYWHQNRTLSGLMKALRKNVKSGVFVGYRLITVHEEKLGL